MRPDLSIDEGTGFSILRHAGFARGHRHGFVVRGPGGRTLFRPGPVPRAEICRAAGLEGASLYLARQVHGAAVIEVPLKDFARGPSRPQPDAVSTPLRAPPERETSALPWAEDTPARVPPAPEASALAEADALITRRAGYAVGVLTADCLPVLLASSDGACAAVHAGWRGLLAGVVEAAVARLREGGSLGAPPAARVRAAAASSSPEPSAGRKRPASGRPGPAIEAAIGAAIGPCCFEVGEDVAGRFRDRFPAAGGCLQPAPAPGKSFLDLTAAAVLVLEQAGVERAAIHCTEACTRCADGPYESYRRDGDRAGRMLALIGRARA